MPVLGNVLLEVDGPEKLKLAATDLAGRERANPGGGRQGGAIAVGASDLFERVR